MKWAGHFAVYFSFSFFLVRGKYKLSEIEILPDPSGEPARIFSAEDMKEYDGSNVSVA